MIRGARPDVCIFHGPSCADGFAAAWAIWQKWKDVTFIPAQYGDELPPAEDMDGKDILIVDFSYPEHQLRALASVARSVAVLDHHISARDTLTLLGDENVIKVTYDEARSGARLAWDYAWGSIPPMLIQYVEDRDLWKFTLPETRAIGALLGSHPYDFDVWTGLAKQIEDPGKRSAAVAEGTAILRDRDKCVRELLAATTRPMLIGEHTVPAANIPYFLASDAGNILAEDQPFAATYFDRGDGLRQFSLRSSADGEDVSEIAKLFGGGGHRHAAGFSVSLDAEEPEEAEEEPAKLGVVAVEE